MYQDFRIVSVSTNTTNKSVTVTTNFDIDIDTVNDVNIKVYDKIVKNEISCTLNPHGKDVVITLNEWPTPNVEYIVSVQNLKNVIGDSLVAGIRRTIIFESSILSKLEITYPAFNEVITDLRISWNEILLNDSGENVNSYYIEVASDNSFNNNIRELSVQDRSTVDINDIQNGQYYIRGRVQKDDQYGEWSDTITFIVGDQPHQPDPVVDDDIYIEPIEIISEFENGVTPTSSIFIEFDCNIDPDSISDIILIRRKL